MCGIWGLIAQSGFDKTDITKTVNDLFILSESRGKEASGIAGIHNGQIISHKLAIPASRLIKTQPYCDLLMNCLSNVSESVVLIGHSRLATNGSEASNNNNQPVCINNTATVHNGIIVNVDELWKSHGELIRTSELDTEVFARMMEYHSGKNSNTVESTKQTYHQIQGMASTLTIFANYHSLIAATNNGSLYYWRSIDRRLILFASEKHIFQKLYSKNRFVRSHFSFNRIVHIDANQAIDVDTRLITAKRFILDPYNIVRFGKCEKKTAPEMFIKRYAEFDIDIEPIKKIKRCTRCILPETMPFIEFDNEGVCNYCRTYKKMQHKGRDALEKWVSKTKQEHSRKEYNSIVSFSGGRDSSYGLHYFVRELGLKPVAYSYDWGMVTDLARRNQSRMCAALGVELITVSADIKKKRQNIRKNILAWMNNPNLGMVPLFMAGDKAYFYYANVIKKRFGLDGILLASNPFEVTYFKSGFCGIKPKILNSMDENLEVEKLSSGGAFETAKYYGNQYLHNGKYVNTSMIDTAFAGLSYYLIPHSYFRLYDYIPWNETEIDNILINDYDWELAPDIKSTWRIGDGTAPFYNYIYYSVCGFTENDTLRSNQIREGVLTRDKALELAYRDNEPRWESLNWYFDTVGLNGTDVLKVVNNMTKLY